MNSQFLCLLHDPGNHDDSEMEPHLACEELGKELAMAKLAAGFLWPSVLKVRMMVKQMPEPPPRPYAQLMEVEMMEPQMIQAAEIGLELSVKV